MDTLIRNKMAYQGLDSLYGKLDVSEKLPESLRLRDIQAASVVRERRTARFMPQGQGQYQYGTGAGFANSSNVWTFRIADSNSYADLQSMYLNFTVQLGESFGAAARTAQADGTAWTVPEDGWWVAFNRGRLLCNSILVEDINQLNSLTSALLYASANSDTYSKCLQTLTLAWKHAHNINGMAGTAGVASRRATIGSVYRTGGTYNTVSVSIPLSLFFDLARDGKYFPLRNTGTGLQIELYVDDIRNYMLAALNNANPSVPCDVSVNFTNIHLTCDMLSLDPAYVSAMDRIMASPEEGGFKVPVNTWLLADTSYQTTTTQAQKQVIVSKATPQLRSMICLKRNPANVNNLAQCYVTSYERLDQGNPIGSLGVQARIGSDLFPQNPIYTVSEHMRELVKCFGGFSMLSDTLLSLPVYCNNYGADAGMAGGGNADGFIWGINFDKNVGLNEHLHLDGYDSTANAMIAIQISDAGTLVPRTETLTVGLQFTRFLVLQAGQAQVVGM